MEIDLSAETDMGNVADAFLDAHLMQQQIEGARLSIHCACFVLDLMGGIPETHVVLKIPPPPPPVGQQLYWLAQHR